MPLSGWTLFEIASVSTFAALAFGFGITVIGLAALAIHPHALVNILPIAPESLRIWAGVAAVGVALALLLMSFERERLANWEIRTRRSVAGRAFLPTCLHFC